MCWHVLRVGCVMRSRYVRMTCAMMNDFGCGVQQAGDGCWAVPRCGYNQISNAAGDGAQDYSSSGSPSPRPPRHTSTYAIEPDASSATYFLAMAAVTGAALYPTLLRSHACALTARVPAACIVTMRACCAIDSPPPPPPSSSSGGRVVARGLLPPPSSMQGDASFYE